MITKLDHTNVDVASRIRAVFQVSYAVEAVLLNAKEFPPLKRTINEILESKNDFYSFLIDDIATSVIEINNDCKSTHIQSLVVDPTFFRQGIAQKLLDFTFEFFDSALITVETGAANQPAINLYEKNGFVEIEKYHTEFDIRKVRFERKIISAP